MLPKLLQNWTPPARIRPELGRTRPGCVPVQFGEPGPILAKPRLRSNPLQVWPSPARKSRVGPLEQCSVDEPLNDTIYRSDLRACPSFSPGRTHKHMPCARPGVRTKRKASQMRRKVRGCQDSRWPFFNADSFHRHCDVELGYRYEPTEGAGRLAAPSIKYAMPHKSDCADAHQIPCPAWHPQCDSALPAMDVDENQNDLLNATGRS